LRAIQGETFVEVFLELIKRCIGMNGESIGWIKSYQHIISIFIQWIGLCYTQTGTPYN
jgi:hypothetical protein